MKEHILQTIADIEADIMEKQSMVLALRRIGGEAPDQRLPMGPVAVPAIIPTLADDVPEERPERPPRRASLPRKVKTTTVRKSVALVAKSAQGVPGKTAARVYVACQGLKPGFSFHDLNLPDLKPAALAYQLRTLAQKKILRELSAGAPNKAATYELAGNVPLAGPVQSSKLKVQSSTLPRPKLEQPPPARPAGRLPHLENEPLEKTLRRCITVLPEPFSRHDVQECLPLLMYQVTPTATWGNELIALRKARVITMVETRLGDDAPVQYQRGPAWNA